MIPYLTPFPQKKLCNGCHFHATTCFVVADQSSVSNSKIPTAISRLEFRNARDGMRNLNDSVSLLDPPTLLSNPFEKFVITNKPPTDCIGGTHDIWQKVKNLLLVLFLNMGLIEKSISRLIPLYGKLVKELSIDFFFYEKCKGIFIILT